MSWPGITDRQNKKVYGDDQAEGLTFDLSQIDLEKLRDEFPKKVRRKATALQDIREIVEQKLAEMLARNPQRMDYYKRYHEIVADYNREKDRATIEHTFAKLVELVERDNLSVIVHVVSWLMRIHLKRIAGVGMKCAL